jgi:hypothetical protein
MRLPPSPASPVRRRPGRFLSVFSAALGLTGCALLVQQAKKQYIRVESAVSSSEIAITLQNSFIETYRNRATIAADCVVERTDRRPHPPFWDGDFHVAVRAADIGLPIVAEIKNAAFEADALDLVRRFAANGTPVRLTGAWRIWMEHVGRSEALQGEAVPHYQTNPDHVFEIHPVTFIGDRSLRESLRPVAGYRPQAAADAFKSFEKIACRIAPGSQSTTIVTARRQYNDAEFLLGVGEEPQQVVEDGRFVSAAVFDLKGNLLAPRVRMVFLKDTPPDRVVKDLPPGSRLHVFGLPRIDLTQIAWRTSHWRDRPESLNLPLPYEIIIAGVYENGAAEAAPRPPYS